MGHRIKGLNQNRPQIVEPAQCLWPFQPVPKEMFLEIAAWEPGPVIGLASAKALPTGPGRHRTGQASLKKPMLHFHATIQQFEVDGLEGRG